MEPAGSRDWILPCNSEMHFADDENYKSAGIGVHTEPELRSWGGGIIVSLILRVFHHQFSPIGLADVLGF